MTADDRRPAIPGADIPATLLLDPDVNADPYPFYERLRTEAPVWRVPGTDVVAVTSNEAIVDLVGRPDDFSNVVQNLIYQGDDGLPQRLPLGELTVEALASADPPIHTVHRKAVFPELVARKMATLEDDVEALATERIDQLVTAGGGDFMADVANVIPITIIGRLIGFQNADPATMLQAAFDSTRMVGATSSFEELSQIIERTVNVTVWVDDEINNTSEDGDSLLATVRRAVSAGDLDQPQGVTILHTLLSAGGESTTSLIGNAVRMLAEHPELQSRLRAEPALVPIFIEEVLRLESPFRQQMRTVVTDTTLDGVDLPAGATVFVFFGAANRDPAEHDDPDEIRLDRATPKHHLAFGRGLHFCVGAPLARLESRLVIERLLTATTSIELDPSAPPRWAYSLLARRHEQLPVVVR